MCSARFFVHGYIRLLCVAELCNNVCLSTQKQCDDIRLEQERQMS